jgi:hypothetical protein
MTTLRLRRLLLQAPYHERAAYDSTIFTQVFIRRTKTEGRLVSVSEKQNPKIEKRAANDEGATYFQVNLVRYAER